jgi:uncharacterized RDD family membrane protein YckC
MTNPDEPAPPQAPTVRWDPPIEEEGPAPGVKFAGHGPRLVAYIVDGVILTVVLLVLVAVPTVLVGSDAQTVSGSRRIGVGAGAVILVVFLLIAIIALGYYPFFWARSGQTPGMRLFRLYLVRDSDGGKVSAGQAILRLVGLWISAIPLYLGFIWIFIDKRRRGWHDLIAGTVMIERTQ